MPNYDFTIQGHHLSLSVARQGSSFLVRHDIGEIACHLIAADQPGFVLEITTPEGSRRQIHVVGAAYGDARQLWVDGQTVAYRRLRQQHRETEHAGSLASTIPAVVAEILVVPGQAVAAGDKLILLESMKMILPIQSPVAGVVKAINCRQGESVKAGVELIIIEPEEKS
ncbi:MAG: acetyl-CoA carboxylase biotin carboxyl carrier protein subunit [Candidatus Promineifilaceae bacterium]